MAHPAKVREYLVASDFKRVYTTLVVGLLEHETIEHRIAGREGQALLVQAQKKLLARMEDMISEYLARLIGEEYTDEELDQLIAIHELPVMKKAMDFAPQLQQTLATYMCDRRQDIETIAQGSPGRTWNLTENVTAQVRLTRLGKTARKELRSDRAVRFLSALPHPTGIPVLDYR